MTVTKSAPMPIALAALSGLVLAAAGCADPAAPPSPPPPTVSVARPVLRPAADARRYTGRLQPAERVEVRARVKGFLDRVLFQEGVEVPRGTPLYEIDPRPFQAEVDHARAEVTRLEAEYRLAEREAERAARLGSASALSAEESDRRAAAKATAAAALARSQARLDSAPLDLGFTRVAAPVPGRVGRTLVTAGNLVGQGEPTLLTTVVRMDPLHLVFEVPEADLLTFAEALDPARAPSPGAGRRVVRFGLDTDAGCPRDAVANR